MSRPCRYCLAAYPILFEGGDNAACEFAHRDEQPLYDLATALARMFQGTRTPSDEQVCWFLEDAEAVIRDFDPVPETWALRKMRPGEGFTARFKVNGITYVVEEGGKDCPSHPVRLSVLRGWQREAEVAARARTEASA